VWFHPGGIPPTGLQLDPEQIRSLAEKLSENRKKKGKGTRKRSTL